MFGYRKDVFDVLEWFKRHSFLADNGNLNWNELPEKSVRKLSHSEAMKLLFDYTLPTQGSRDSLKSIYFPNGHFLGDYDGKGILLNDGSVLVIATTKDFSDIQYYHFSPYLVECPHKHYHLSNEEDWKQGVPVSSSLRGYRTYVCDNCGFWWETDSSD